MEMKSSIPLWMLNVCSCLLFFTILQAKGQISDQIPSIDSFREGRSGANWADGVTCPMTLAQKGSWGAMEVCPDNLPADGFSLKVERNLGWGKDDSALNAVYFTCFMSDKVIHSKEGQWGDTKVTQSCPFGTVIVGVQMQSDAASAQDNAGASNIRVHCDHIYAYGGRSKILEGEGIDFGQWCEWFRCPQGSYVCGLQTRVEDDGGSGYDDTALNDIKFKCCKVNEIEFDFKDMSMYGNSTK